GIEFLDFSRQQPLHLAATFLTATIVEAEQLADLRERKAIGLRLLDEPQSLGDRGRIHAKASTRAPSTRHQTDTLVVPECIDGQTASRGEFTDLERRVLCHRASLRVRQQCFLSTQRRGYTFDRRGNIAQAAAAPRAPHLARPSS